ncbi:MAG: NfeD family protein [Pseudomonadota bacterium]
MLDAFNILEGMSPWWWVAFGIALGAIEMATMSFFLLWPALAAIIMAVLLALMPGMPGEVQIALFAAIAVALTFAGRSLVRRYGDGGEPETSLNKRGDRMVGRRAKVLSFNGVEGRVEIDGVQWRAQRTDGNFSLGEGQSVQVVKVDGMTLHVEP